MIRRSPGEKPAPWRPSSYWFLGMGVGTLLAFSGGCDLGSGPPPSPDLVEAVDGTDQTATVGTPVPVAPAVRVLNKKGRPMPRREVVFSVVSGGGQLSSNFRITDKEGIARVGAWILGTTAGAQTLQALVEELPPLIFVATGTAANPATIVINGGDDQTGVVGSTLEIKPSVLIKDAYENPVGNATVAFNVTPGGGLLTQNSGVTNSSGVAEGGAWILGTTPGPYGLSASVQGLSPVDFTATGIPDVPSRVTVLIGDGQTATVGTELPLRPTLLVADRFGNLLEGVPVVFEVTAGGGAIAGSTQITGPLGVAVAGAWTVGTAAGPQALLITVPGVDPLTLTATAEAGPPASALAQGGGTQSATVGTAVPDPPRLRVEDAFGNPVSEVRVTFSPTASPDPERSPGTVDGPVATTDVGGVVSAESWTLGTIAGPYEVTAVVSGLDEPVTFYATAIADVPSALVVHEGDNQTAQFGTTVPIPPAVRIGDQYGNGVAGVPVNFAIVEGGGTLTGAQGLTDGEGVAALGSWTLGPTPGANRVWATVEGIGSVAFEAVGLTASPAAMTKVAGNGQMAPVGTQVPVPPQIRITDAGGNPVSWIPVVFSVVSGGGSLTQEVATTDSEGLATVGSWTLGTTAGSNALSASAGALPSVTFSATGIPGPPAFMWSNDGDGQGTLVNTGVPIPPSVLAQDSYGNPVHGVTVTFAVTGGGGSVTGPLATTDGKGVARVGSWILGPSPGINHLTASLSGVPDVVFEAMGMAAGGFQVDLEFMTSVDPAVGAIFQDAAARWEEIIVGDIPDYGGSLPAGGCQPVLEAGGIDDVKIYVTVMAIDGSGGVLGRAGPCYYRTIGGVFPITGIMELDEADLADMQAAGLLEDVIVHEMGHVLGFGTLWNASSNDFLVGGGTADPYFNGAAAVAAFDAAGGASRTDPKVPVENTGGAGTRDGHWRESVHNSELMTGWIEGGGGTNPLSAITIASFADMGYTVNMGAADPYVLFNPLGAPAQQPSKEMIYIKELPPPTPIPADPGGRNPGP